MKIGIIDTHILVWYFEGGKKLSRAEQRFLDDEKNRLIIPGIVLCETKYLVHKGRLKVDFDLVLRAVTGDSRIEIAPLDLDIIGKMPPGLEMHDGIIVATAMSYQESEELETLLLTRDEEIKSLGRVRIL
jgi:PIN domain nuclease of toxin-antitoxin system